MGRDRNMNTDPIRYVPIWSGWLRAAHWLIAAGVLFELFSAWTLGQGATDPGFWRDWHVIVGQFVALALLLRIALLFVPGSSHWRALLPKRGQWRSMLQTLKFYLSLTRAPLPAWYAHNPLWAPVYLLVLLLLVACVASGFLHDAPYRLFGLQPDTLHAGLGEALALFSLFHVIAAALHDWKGDGALVSAMFSGKRYFHVNRQQQIENRMLNTGIPVDITPGKPTVKNPQQK
jgi:Ni/Fe-hydrogenase 1 B-type cytochrome subunit